MFSVTVLIRNRNEADNLRVVLTRLDAQHTRPFEIIVVDNESDDHSRAVIAEFGATLVHLPAAQFTYGRATNLGFEHARGELILMLSAHSIPIGSHFVDDVTVPFVDPRVAAARIPIAANTNELRSLGQLPPLDRHSSATDIFGRAPAASGAVIRRSVWERFRVDETLEAAEDKEWAMRVLRSGDWIIPTANACYAYVKTYTSNGWLRKLQREERAGFLAAGLQRDTNWLHVVRTLGVGVRDTFEKVRTESAMCRFRRRLR